MALVTGGSRGIGAAAAVELAADGWDIAISYRRRADEATAVIARCQALGRRASAWQADMAVPADIVDLFASVDGSFGRLDLLVNNAGVVSPPGPVDTYTAERLDGVLRVNVIGAFLAAGAAVRRMSIKRGGRGG